MYLNFDNKNLDIQQTRTRNMKARATIRRSRSTQYDSRCDYESSLSGYSPDRLSFSPNRKRAHHTNISKANASWDLLVESKGSYDNGGSIHLKENGLRRSLNTTEKNTPSPEQQRQRPKKYLPLKEDPELNSLLRTLQTDAFVGEIDPVYHSRYVECSNHNEIMTTRTDEDDNRSPKARLVASYKSDGHLFHFKHT
jgi:hypothetical protein